MKRNRRNKGRVKRHYDGIARPNTSNTLVDTIETHYRAGRFQEAESVCRQILERQPRNSDALSRLAQIVNRDGRPAEAIGLIEQAIVIAAKPEYFYRLGVALKALGRAEDAIAAFRRAIGIRKNYVEAHAGLVELKTFEAKDADVVALERILTNRSLSPEDETRLRFALAKIWDDCGDYESSFRQLEKANALKRASIDYDVSLEEMLVDRIMEVFTRRTVRAHDRGRNKSGGVLRSFFKSRGRGADDGTKLIFIVGMPRSGTTLIEQILSSHSRVTGVGERNELKDMVALKLSHLSPAGKGFPNAILDISMNDLAALGETYTTTMQRLAPGAGVIADKTPMNFLFVGLIRMLWPDARIIHCTRNPVATCFSCYSKLFTGDQKFTYDLTELGRYYRNFERLMHHWRGVLPGFMLDVRYEDIVSDLETQARRLLAFCDLPWEEQCLAFYKTERPVLTASAMQVRKPIFSSAVAHWKHYESFLTPLLVSLGDRAR